MTPLHSLKKQISEVMVPPSLLTGLPDTYDKHRSDVRKLIIEQVFDYYNMSLKKSRRALEFIENVIGIRELSLIDEFSIGFVDRTLGRNIPHRDSYHGGRLRGELQRLGILKANGREAFRGALVFPLFDIDGKPQGIFGVWIGYLPIYSRTYQIIWSEESYTLFNPKVLLTESSWVLCRTPVEASLLWSLGCRKAFSLVCNYDNRSWLKSVIDDYSPAHIELLHHSELDNQWTEECKQACQAHKQSSSVTTIADYCVLQ